MVVVHLADGSQERIDGAVSSRWQRRGGSSMTLTGVGGGASEYLLCLAEDGSVVKEFAKKLVRNVSPPPKDD